ncbi:DgyrCDS14160 [Dimorphilus gyrociliatus]|uniref:DgyrCDS14160 n=1 Tax=Dimorphilus gyrociliatus TaxID=2664684 RepID=A0A7I8WCR3_9ANNE|nr:DgyrCDS14160 [Dimorphilus gyrociliatus]
MFKFQAFQWIFITFSIIVICDGAKFRYRPVNTAVFKDSSALLNCSAIDAPGYYEYTNWVFKASQTSDTYIIANNYEILIHLQSRFKLPDDDTYHLLNTKVDEYTTGLYECVGFRNGSRDTYYHAYLSAIDETPKCAKVDVPNQDYVQNKDIAYCHTEYAGNWAPRVKIETANNLMNFAQFTSHDDNAGPSNAKYSTVGACALIDKGESFKCAFDFEAPPYDLVFDKSYHDEPPEFSGTTCENPASVDTNVPAYLKEKCLEFLKLPDKNTRLTNSVARLDASTVLKCNDINENEHDAGAYTLTQSQTGEGWILTNSFEVYDHLKSLFRFETPNVFDLTVLDTTTQLTGKYSCSGFKNGNLTDSYSAFVVAMAIPNCKRKTHANLGINQNLAFCFNDYSGNWAPKVNMTDKDDKALTFGTFDEPMIGSSAPASRIGACAIVTDDVLDSFKCSMKFGAPPEALIKDFITDRSEPNVSPETCTSSDGLPSIPDWIMTKCEDFFNIAPEPTTITPTTKPTTKATTKPTTKATTKATTLTATEASATQTKFSIFLLAIFSSITCVLFH